MIEEIKIEVEGKELAGELNLPENTKRLAIFAHGSGSSRFSPRNLYVADVLNQAGIGTCLFDLLTEEEDELYENRFDIDLISGRLTKATRWLMAYPQTEILAYGYFGASTGAAAAMRAAAELGVDQIKAIVSRGGRPDLAMEVLPLVISPTLLIVGGNDFGVIELNNEAFERLGGKKELKIIPRATHLFEEEGALEQVAESARDWFLENIEL